MGWNETESILETLASAVRQRQEALTAPRLMKESLPTMTVGQSLGAEKHRAQERAVESFV